MTTISLRRAAATALPVLMLTISGVAPASAASAQLGLNLARKWCSSCHTVEAGQSPASDKAPAFTEIAARRDDKWVKTWLENPHPPMTGITLTHIEISNLNAYIKSLAPKTP